MSSPTITIQPRIAGKVFGTADLGQLLKDFDWPASSLGSPLYNFLPGTSSGQMDTWFDDIRTLTTGATESLDLVGTALTDPFGASVSMLHVNIFAIYSALANTTDLTVGNVTNGVTGWLTAATHSNVIRPGGLMLFVDPGAGYALTAATADLVKVANASGASASYHIIAGGRSA